MRKISFRITAKGYIVISALLLILILTAGLITRVFIPETQLIFALNKELRKESAAYAVDFEFETLGDAVLYKDKHFEMNTTFTRDLEKYHLKGSIQSKLIVLPALEAFFTEEAIYIKTPFTQQFKNIKYNDLSTINNSNSLSLTEVVALLDLKDPEFLDLLYSNLFKIKDIFDENVEINNKEVVFSITLDEAFDKIDQTILMLSKQELFVEQIKNRYSKLYDKFGQHSIWGKVNITSMILFNGMVSLDNDFYTTTHNNLMFVKKQFNHFKGNSLLEVRFSFKMLSLESISFTGQFDYKKFDANENISLTIQPIEYENIQLPDGDISSLKPYVKKLYDSLKTEFK